MIPERICFVCSLHFSLATLILFQFPPSTEACEYVSFHILSFRTAVKFLLSFPLFAFFAMQFLVLFPLREPVLFSFSPQFLLLPHLLVAFLPNQRCIYLCHRTQHEFLTVPPVLCTVCSLSFVCILLCHVAFPQEGAPAFQHSAMYKLMLFLPLPKALQLLCYQSREHGGEQCSFTSFARCECS